jgi:hypothetical protein
VGYSSQNPPHPMTGWVPAHPVALGSIYSTNIYFTKVRKEKEDLQVPFYPLIIKNIRKPKAGG